MNVTASAWHSLLELLNAHLSLQNELDAFHKASPSLHVAKGRSNPLNSLQ